MIPPWFGTRYSLVQKYSGDPFQGREGSTHKFVVVDGGIEFSSDEKDLFSLLGIENAIDQCRLIKVQVMELRDPMECLVQCFILSPHYQRTVSQDFP